MRYESTTSGQIHAIICLNFQEVRKIENKSDSQLAAFKGAQIREILPQLSEVEAAGHLVFAHEDSEAEWNSCFEEIGASEDATAFPMFDASSLLKLADLGREQYGEVLDARIVDIKEIPFGHVALVSGVEPEEMARFADDYANFMEAEQQMGPAM